MGSSTMPGWPSHWPAAPSPPGLVLNYMPVTGLLHDSGKVAGVTAQDAEGGRSFTLSARVVINATGVWADALRRMDEPGCASMLSPSQGVHLVVGAQWLPGGDALLVPETEDGRVLFMIPWQGKVLLGTTDTPARMSRSSRGPARGDRFHPPHGGLLSRGPRPPRCVERLRRPSATHLCGTGRAHRPAFARARHPHFPERPGDHRWRQVDHLQANGRRGDRPCGEARGGWRRGPARPPSCAW